MRAQLEGAEDLRGAQRDAHGRAALELRAPAGKRMKTHLQRAAFGRSAASASTAPRWISRDLDARKVDGDARTGGDGVARAAEDVQRADAQLASGGGEPQCVAGVQRALHQRAGHDRPGARYG